MENLVSVIIPCYNTENHIYRALESLLNQTYTNIEIVCVNDGSSDRTGEILGRYSYENNNIKVITTGNQGVSSARNTGIETSNGKYIMFCDADDIYATDCVKNLIENMERMGVDTAYGYWSSDIKKIENINTTVKQTTQEEMLKHFMYRKTPLSFLNFVYRRDILDAYHIHFNEKFRYGEDNLFFWQYLCHIKTGVYVKAPLYWYYQNPDSAMHNPTWRITDSCEAVKEARNYMRECNFDYIDEFISYMPARTGFHIAKEFARYGMKKEFNRFITEYKMKYEAKKLIHKNGLILTVCSALLYVSPMLFYHMIHIIYTIKFRVNRNGIK